MKSQESYSFDTAIRTKHLLKLLRNGAAPIEILEDTLLGGKGDAENIDFKLAMKGMAGESLTCSPESPEKTKSVEGRPPCRGLTTRASKLEVDLTLGRACGSGARGCGAAGRRGGDG